MKIGFELQPLLKTKTGVGFYVSELSNHLYKFEDDNLQVFGFYMNPFFLKKKEDNINQIKMRKITNRCLHYGIYRRIWHKTLFNFNSLFRERFDLYHFTNFIVPPKIEGKIVLTVHDVVNKLFPETMTKSNYNRLNKELERSIIEADKIIAVSNDTKNQIIKFYNVPEEKITVIYHGINQIPFIYDEDYFNKIKQKYNLPDKYFLYLGTLEPRKNIIGILNSFANFILSEKCRDYFLVLAGPKGWGYKEVFETISRLRIQDNVVFIGYVDENDKPYLYSKSEIFLFPSLYEGFGLPLLEAMKYGTPIITSNKYAMKEIAEGSALLVNPNNIEEITYAIKKILFDVHLKENLIQNGYKRVNYFTWEKAALKTIELYKELA